MPPHGGDVAIQAAPNRAAFSCRITLSADIVMNPTSPDDGTALCQSCGACCAFSRAWPRFSVEDDADLARIPRALVDKSQARMRCHGDRCSALEGDVGVATSCAVYAVRPEV